MRLVPLLQEIPRQPLPREAVSGVLGGDTEPSGNPLGVGLGYGLYGRPPGLVLETQACHEDYLILGEEGKELDLVKAPQELLQGQLGLRWPFRLGQLRVSIQEPLSLLVMGMRQLQELQMVKGSSSEMETMKGTVELSAMPADAAVEFSDGLYVAEQTIGRSRTQQLVGLRQTWRVPEKRMPGINKRRL